MGHFRELVRDTPVWVRVLVVVQIVAYVVLAVGVVFVVQSLTEMDWSHGLEGVVMKIWKGK